MLAPFARGGFHAPPRATQGVGPTLPGGASAWKNLKIDLPETNFPPAGATAVQVIGDGQLTGTVEDTIFTFFVPADSRLRIDKIGFDADDEAALAFMFWNLGTLEGPVPGFERVPALYGTVANAEEIFAIIAGQATVRVRISQVDPIAAGTHSYRVRISGWLYTPQLVEGA